MIAALRPMHIVRKAWGGERWIANGPSYCGKILDVLPGHRCSLHYHIRKAETLYVLEGSVLFEWAPHDRPEELRQKEMWPGSALDVQPYLAHRFTALAWPASIIETSTQHFEDDSVRLEQGGRIE